MERHGKLDANWKIRVLSADAVHVTFTPTWHSSRGSKKAKSDVGVLKLERPGETKVRGGGSRLWVFEEGVLTNLRTYRGGATTVNFAVLRNAKTFDCTANVSWLRETGVPNVIFRSVIADAWLELLSAKQVASNCRVTTRGEAAMP